jgi:hypothetical protein
MCQGINRLPLENYVRHIYMDVPETYPQDEFYGIITSILPLLENLRSLYFVLRHWNKYIWNVQLGSYIPEHAPPSLQRLSIQVSHIMAYGIYVCSPRISDTSWRSSC